MQEEEEKVEEVEEKEEEREASRRRRRLHNDSYNYTLVAKGLEICRPQDCRLPDCGTPVPVVLSARFTRLIVNLASQLT